MKSLTLNQKTYGFSVLLSAAMVSAFVFFIEPTQSTLSENLNKANLLKIEHEIAQNQAGKVSEFQSEYQSILDTDADIAHHFFTVGEELAFFQEIERVAAAAGVTLAIQFTPTKDERVLKSVLVTLQTTGTAMSMISFIDRLEHLHQYLTLTAVRLESSEVTTATIEMLSHWHSLSAI